MKEYPACTHNLQPQFQCFAGVESLYRSGDNVSDVEKAGRPLDDNHIFKLVILRHPQKPLAISRSMTF
jgi:hypothetical protein